MTNRELVLGMVSSRTSLGRLVVFFFAGGLALGDLGVLTLSLTTLGAFIADFLELLFLAGIGNLKKAGR